jgi:hypothetical protein
MFRRHLSINMYLENQVNKHLHVLRFFLFYTGKWITDFDFPIVYYVPLYTNRLFGLEPIHLTTTRERIIRRLFFSFFLLFFCSCVLHKAQWMNKQNESIFPLIRRETTVKEDKKKETEAWIIHYRSNKRTRRKKRISISHHW